jgi:hypothetical protein
MVVVIGLIPWSLSTLLTSRLEEDNEALSSETYSE